MKSPTPKVLLRLSIIVFFLILLASYYTSVLPSPSTLSSLIPDSFLDPLHNPTANGTTNGPAGPKPRYAFSTFMAKNTEVSEDDDDADGYFVLIKTMAYQLKHALDTKSDPSIPFIVVVTEDVSQRKRNKLTSYGATVVELEKIVWEKAAVPRWRDVMTKLRLFQMTEYDKILFMDADMLIYRRLDGIFKDEATQVIPNLNKNDSKAVKSDEAPQPDTYMMAGRPEFPPTRKHSIPPHESNNLNAGFFVFKPSQAMFEYYLSLLELEGRFPPGYPEQNLFNYAHRMKGNMPWKHLHWTWNMNWANYEDLLYGCRSFHARYHLNETEFKKADPELRRIWREQRDTAKSYFTELGYEGN